MGTLTKCLAVLAGVALLGVAPRPSRAWSGPGHQAVCQIAYLELAPAARKKLTAIMAREPDNRFRPFASACLWPDDQKRTPGTIQNKRRNDHFINVDRSLGAITDDGCGAAQSCLFTAIAADEKVVKNGTGAKQLVALKFLGHWLGDLHQPLHVSFADDQGGNTIPVGNEGGCSEIHGVWDNCVPDALRRKMGANVGPTDFGTRLQKEITPAERADWRKGDPAAWAEESYAVARDARTGYCLTDGQRCCYDATSCTYDGGPKTKRLAHLADGYDRDHVEIVRERLKKAGVRLAAILEAQLE